MTNGQSTVLSITFNEEFTGLKVFDADSLELFRAMYVTDDSELPDYNVCLLISQSFIGYDQQSRGIIDRLRKRYNVPVFYTDAMYSLRNTDIRSDSVAIYDECIHLLKTDHSPEINNIRPYMCEFYVEDVDVIRLKDPIECMKRYIELCERTES